MKIEQLIWVGNSHEIATEHNSERPNWPVQEEDGTWKHPKFEGQRVVYVDSEAHFGFKAVEVSEGKGEGFIQVGARTFKEVK